MIRYLTIGFSLLGLFLLTGCAHHNDVRVKEDGNHYIFLTAKKKNEGFKAATKQANYFCKKQDKTVFTLEEEIKYTGSIPEEEFLRTLAITDGLETVGNIMWIIGENSVDDAGALLSVGSGIAESSMGQPYEVHFKFKCS